MTFLLIFHAILAGLGTALVFTFHSTQPAISFLAGAGVSLLNLSALVYSITRILAKKQVALSIGVIVFKFAILGWIIYEVVRGTYLQVGWFAAGLGLVIPTVIVTAFKLTPKIPEKAES